MRILSVFVALSLERQPSRLRRPARHADPETQTKMRKRPTSQVLGYAMDALPDCAVDLLGLTVDVLGEAQRRRRHAEAAGQAASDEIVVRIVGRCVAFGSEQSSGNRVLQTGAQTR